MYWAGIQGEGRTLSVVRAVAAVLALGAVGCMTAAIIGMVSGHPGDRVGWVLRAAAVLLFAGAVALNAAAH
jgi:hypothetical protein